MRVLGPKEYLESLKYQRLNEEVFQNDVNWGDSLVGRMFSSIGRKITNVYNDKKIEDLLKKLRDELNVQALPTVVKENPDLKDSVDKVKLGYIIKSLIDLLNDKDIDGIKELSKKEEFNEVLNKLPENDKDYIKNLIESEEEGGNGDEDEEGVSVGDIGRSLSDFNTIIDNVFLEGYIDFSEYLSINENINNFDQFKVLIKRDKDIIKKNLKTIFTEIKKFSKDSQYTIIKSVQSTKNRKISEISKEIYTFFKMVKDGKIDIKNKGIKDRILNLKLNESLIREFFEWDDNETAKIIANLNKIDTSVDSKDLSNKDKSVKDIKQFPINSLNIVKIFNEASRIFIKQRIPSSRTGGKISGSRAEDWEKIDRSGNVEGVNPESPGTGPFRKISLYNKWNKGVLSIINEYDYIISNAVIVGKDGKVVKNKEGDNVSPLKKFMVDSLEKPEMQISGGAQSTYLKDHLGMDDKSINNLGFNDSKNKKDKKDDISKTDTKWEWVDVNTKYTELRGLLKFKMKRPVQLIFMNLNNTEVDFPVKDDDRWLYLYIAGSNKNDKNEYKYWGIFTDRDDWIKSDGYKTESNTTVHKNNIYYCEIKLNKESIDLKNVYDIYDIGEYNKGDKIKNLTFKSIKVIKKYVKDGDNFKINDNNKFINGCKKQKGLQKQ